MTEKHKTRRPTKYLLLMIFFLLVVNHRPVNTFQFVDVSCAFRVYNMTGWGKARIEVECNGIELFP